MRSSSCTYLKRRREVMPVVQPLSRVWRMSRRRYLRVPAEAGTRQVRAPRSLAEGHLPHCIHTQTQKQHPKSQSPKAQTSKKPQTPKLSQALKTPSRAPSPSGCRTRPIEPSKTQQKSSATQSPNGNSQLNPTLGPRNYSSNVALVL